MDAVGQVMHFDDARVDLLPAAVSWMSRAWRAVRHRNVAATPPAAVTTIRPV